MAKLLYKVTESFPLLLFQNQLTEYTVKQSSKIPPYMYMHTEQM